MSVLRGLFARYGSPPDARTPRQDNPTLLVTWWCTGCCIALILMRLMGRYVRVSKLYRDDKFMALTIIPLLAHQAFVHVVLIYETNNAAGVQNMGPEELRRRQIGSGMVLGARVTYAAFLWSQKFCITEFYMRLTDGFWERSYEIGLRIIRWSLLATFLASTISIFAYCQPGYKLWQVQPDPGAQCRTAFAPLITVSTFSILTDALLVLCPIPAIVRTSFTTAKKIRLIITVFSLSLFCIAFAGYRVPTVIRAHGSQHLRSLLAAFEILTATMVSNAIVINSFARDKGAKKRKFTGESGIEGAEAGQVRRAYWGSDDDLARYLGVGRVPGISAERLQRGYGLSGCDTEGALQTPSTAVLHGATAPREAELREISPIMSPLSLEQERNTPVLYDIGGLLKDDEDNDTDDDARTSVSSSSTGLRDIVRKGELQR
ncbi:hypothetical protein FN846DRAFT_886384 [Sphaerosporella brunnea]|uniref:Rhodopsin domain-containing protein n=1 Tax=Sphaerosporella brunnea TaxID=1250544 RepID=A0A5J5F9T1_9PEZI|nr:hypothetical protein FN846DRAFT_886384 [Sphaerosporella brunnea]